MAHLSRQLLKETATQIPVKPSKSPLKITIISYNTADLFSLPPELLNHYASILFNAVKMTMDALTKWLHHQPYFDCGSFDEKKVWEVDKNYDCECYELGPLSKDDGDWTVLFAKLYLFASKYEIPLLQKDAIDRLVLMCADTNPVYNMYADENEPDFSGAAEYVYAHTSTGHVLRTVLVDGFCIFPWDESETETLLMSLPKEFLTDVMMRNPVFDAVDGPKIQMNVHQYHECDDEVVTARGGCTVRGLLRVIGGR